MQVPVYSNLKLKKLLEIISQKFGLSEKELKVKMVDETKIIRLDS